MNPEDQLRALRAENRWEQTALSPRLATTNAASTPHHPKRVLPVVVTAMVAVLVIAASIGAIRLASPSGNERPAVTSTPRVDGANAVIRGTASTTTRIIAGVGTSGGPAGADLRSLRALAERTGKLNDQPTPSRGYQVRLAAAFTGVRAAFGSAVHEYGGFGSNGFFIVLNRAPTADELQLLRLLPMQVRLHWGPRISKTERNKQQQAAFTAVQGVALDAGGFTESETDTQVFSYWPNRDRPRTAQQIAEQMAAVISRVSGAAPTFTIRVTDRSRTPEGQAALHSTGRTVADDGTRLLVGARPTQTGIGVGVYGPLGLGLNKQRCVALEDTVVIAPPGSSISADGTTIHAKGIGTYNIPSPGTSLSDAKANSPTGGAFIDAKTAATYLPRGSTLCGATRFLLIA